MTTATLIARPHPFSQRPAVCQVRAGRTILQMLEDVADGTPLASTLRVDVGDIEVPKQLWDRVKPKAGTQIAVTVMPAGGDGSGKWIRAILMIVVAVVAWYAVPQLYAAYGIGVATGAAISAGISMLGPITGPALVPRGRR